MENQENRAKPDHSGSPAEVDGMTNYDTAAFGGMTIACPLPVIPAQAGIQKDD